jgi:acyl dehydratase
MSSMPGFRTVVLDQERISHFAEAMHDPNPVHRDGGFARSLGLPGPIAPGGMVVVAACHAAVRAHGLESVREVDVAMRAPVHVGDVLECVLERADEQPSDGSTALSVEVLANGERLCAKGTIVVDRRGACP